LIQLNLLKMAFQFVTFAALVAAASAGVVPAAPLAYHAPQLYAAPVAKAVVAKAVDADYDPHPQYSYSYDVQDSITGDSKNQFETRDGDLVHGSYSLLEADGTRRTVDYTADPVNGFNAVVRKEPAGLAVKAVAAAPVVAKVAAPVAYAAPHYHAAPAYAAPAYAAPAYAKFAAPAISYAAPHYHAYAAPAKFAYAAPALYHH
jgi:hypothetical protein